MKGDEWWCVAHVFVVSARNLPKTRTFSLNEADGIHKWFAQMPIFQQGWCMMCAMTAWASNISQMPNDAKLKKCLNSGNIAHLAFDFWATFWAHDLDPTKTDQFLFIFQAMTSETIPTICHDPVMVCLLFVMIRALLTDLIVELHDVGVATWVLHKKSNRASLPQRVAEHLLQLHWKNWRATTEQTSLTRSFLIQWQKQWHRGQHVVAHAMNRIHWAAPTGKNFFCKNLFDLLSQWSLDTDSCDAALAVFKFDDKHHQLSFSVFVLFQIDDWHWLCVPNTKHLTAEILVS